MLSKLQGRSRQQGWLRKAAAGLPQSMGRESRQRLRILDQSSMGCPLLGFPGALDALSKRRMNQIQLA
jgi:hypothetical protein